MKIENLICGRFIERPNRFLVKFKDGTGKTDLAHLKDPGRLKELLTPNVKLLLRKAISKNKRKTNYDVIAVFNCGIWVLLNSGFHSDIAAELIESGEIKELTNYSIERREYTYGNSRIDFLLTNNQNKKMLLEVKGCTLVDGKIAKFPDAPTLRGKRHLDELIFSINGGYKSIILFLILRGDAIDFTPNMEMDPNFSYTLKEAKTKGVNIVAYSFENIYKKDVMEINPFKRLNLKIDF